MLFILSSGWSAADGGLILGPQSRSRTLGALNHGDKRDALVMSRPSFISLPVSANGLLLFSHSSYVQLFETPWTAAHRASLSINSQSVLKLMSIKVMPSNPLFLCHPLLPQPSVFPSIRVFSNESALRIRWPKYWSFSFSIHLSNEYSVLISFRIEWFDLLAAQGTLKSLHHSSKASILRSSAFFMVQLSHPYMTTGKTIALAVWTFFGKVMSLLFNVLFQVCHSSSSKEQANNRMNLSYNFLTATISHSLLSMLEGTQLLFVTLTPEGHFHDHWADLSLLPGKLATTVMRISAVMWIRGHVPHLQAQAHYSPATVAK